MRSLYRLGWLFFRFIFATYFRWRYFNPERVPHSGPVILASNHASFIDPPLVGSALPRPLSYMARDTLFRFPLLGALLRSWNAVPVDREGGGAAGLRQILDALQAGNAIIIFPEGTRTRDGQLQHARAGIGLMVLKSAAPVVPVRVFGTYEAYGRHIRLPRPKPVAVKFGAPIDFSALRAEARSCTKARLREIYQEIADTIMTSIASLEPVQDAEEARAATS
ncbi:MAG: lysophospholipid acyltransferase family protein [Verrucomicrobiia bacterium]